jgi:glycosyltransferase involved in cell wall biosynthesis
MPLSISAIIITKNEELSIGDCLKSISWVDEIIVVDSGSNDRTVEICKSFGAKVFIRKWQGYGRQKNIALNLATKNWILSIDADERITDSLKKEIQALDDSQYAYSIKRKSNYCGSWIYYGDWRSDYVVRLFKRKSAKFSHALVHEAILSKYPIKKLKAEMLHFTYHNYEDVIKKINIYSSAAAQILFFKKTKSSLTKAIFHSLWAFLRSYFLRCGFLDGQAGFALALSNAQYTYYKYLKLLFLNQKKKKNSFE